VFDVDIDTGRASNGKVFADNFKPGFTDGMRCDIDGNVWCSMGWADPKEDGVRCYSSEGDLLGKIHVPETVAKEYETAHVRVSHFGLLVEKHCCASAP
jgi:gluconolactonase